MLLSGSSVASARSRPSRAIPASETGWRRYRAKGPGAAGLLLRDQFALFAAFAPAYAGAAHDLPAHRAQRFARRGQGPLGVRLLVADRRELLQPRGKALDAVQVGGAEGTRAEV